MIRRRSIEATAGTVTFKAERTNDPESSDQANNTPTLRMTDNYSGESLNTPINPSMLRDLSVFFHNAALDMEKGF